MALTSTLESWADTSTGCPTLKRADRATAAGIRTARLLPHCWTVKIALLAAMTTLRCINKFIHRRRNVNDAAWRSRQVKPSNAMGESRNNRKSFLDELARQLGCPPHSFV